MGFVLFKLGYIFIPFPKPSRSTPCDFNNKKNKPSRTTMCRKIT